MNLSNIPSGKRAAALGVICAIAVGVLATAGVQAYVLSGKKWASSPITYYVNPANPQGLSASSVIAAIQQGAGAWSTQSRANVALSYGGTTNVSTVQYDGLNIVTFRAGSGPFAYTTYWFDGSNRLLDADMAIYTDTATWYTGTSGCSGNGAYIEDVTTHEFGHVLGLDHSSVGTATMYPSANYCATTLRDLDPDDISGVEALYPPVGNPPAAPSNLTGATSASSPTTTANLGWVNNATNATGYRVQRSLDGVNFSQIAQLGSSATSYVDGSLSPGTVYYFRVYAYNSAGSSAYSNVAGVQTVAPAAITSAPSTPSNPSPANGATGLGTSLTLGWSATGAQSYDVYLYVSTSSTPAKTFLNLTTASVSVSSLANSTTYTWKVVAKNSVGSTTGPLWAFTTKSKPGGGKR